MRKFDEILPVWLENFREMLYNRFSIRRYLPYINREIGKMGGKGAFKGIGNSEC